MSTVQQKMFIIGLILLSLLIHKRVAYSVDVTDFQTWTNFSVQTNLGNVDQQLNQLDWFGQVQERFAEDSTRFFETLLRTGVIYNITPQSSVGFGYVYLYTDDVFVPEPVNVSAPWQQYAWQSRFDDFSLLIRSRLEERFFNNDLGLIWRLREMVEIQIPIDPIPGVSFVTSDELFINLSGIKGFEDPGLFQNRYYLGLRYQLTENMNVDTGYINQYINDFENESFMVNILYLSLGLNF